MHSEPRRSANIPPVARLIEALQRLPGIGPKTAQRLTFYLVRAPVEEVSELAQAIAELRAQIRFCSVCHNITVADPCGICASEARDRDRICVVEEPLDVSALERTGEYHGLYHVLHGVISPVDGIGPDDLRIDALMARMRAGGIDEVILATNPNLEGEATAMYLARLLSPLGVRVTRLARGLPMGGDLEYADEVTLSRAITGRREV
ncbi:MAG: recombination mediator RecR [Chloroflexi bacterium]|nr:recombination mediator RecR [Chloroflexota bacterium]MBU1748419.1 recombination mediator RecR [Chloroflexota bacterium]